MSFQPLQVTHPAQRYVAIAATLARSALGVRVPGLFAQVYAWLEQQRVAVTGAPLIRYVQVDPAQGALLVHVGFPVGDAALEPKAPLVLGELPAGIYVTLVHRGSYEGLVTTTAQLLDWGQSQQIAWQHNAASTQYWTSRVEHYLVGPPAQPDPAHWHTEVAILRR